MAKRQLDQFDLEAEREGSAVRKDAEAAIERRTVKGYYARSV